MIEKYLNNNNTIFHVCLLILLIGINIYICTCLNIELQSSDSDLSMKLVLDSPQDLNNIEATITNNYPIEIKEEFGYSSEYYWDDAKTLEITRGLNYDEIIMKNFDSYLINNRIMVHNEYNNSIDLSNINNLMFELNNNSTITSPKSVSDINTEIVNLLQNGNNVIIVSSPIDSISTSNTGMLTKYFENQDNTPITENQINIYRESGQLMTIQQADVLLNSSVNKPLIISYPTDEPKPLPSWYQVAKQPSMNNWEERVLWEKNVAIQKKWVAKYPFLAEHYEQIHLSNSKVSEWAKHLQSIDNSLNKQEEIHTNTDWMEEESYNLDLLFEEENNVDWMEKEESFNLDTLFDSKD